MNFTFSLLFGQKVTCDSKRCPTLQREGELCSDVIADMGLGGRRFATAMPRSHRGGSLYRRLVILYARGCGFPLWLADSVHLPLSPPRNHQ